MMLASQSEFSGRVIHTGNCFLLACLGRGDDLDPRSLQGSSLFLARSIHFICFPMSSISGVLFTEKVSVLYWVLGVLAPSPNITYCTTVVLVWPVSSFISSMLEAGASEE